MTEHSVRDYNRNPLAEGDRVTAWLDGQRYAATVKEIKPHHPGCGDHRHIVVVREDDRTEVESFSDAVVVITQTPAPSAIRVPDWPASALYPPLSEDSEGEQ